MAFTGVLTVRGMYSAGYGRGVLSNPICFKYKIISISCVYSAQFWARIGQNRPPRGPVFGGKKRGRWANSVIQRPAWAQRCARKKIRAGRQASVPYVATPTAESRAAAAPRCPGARPTLRARRRSTPRRSSACNTWGKSRRSPAGPKPR